MTAAGDEVKDRARGCLLGLAVGDALGGPVEWLSSRGIPARWLDLLEPRDELVRLADPLAAGDESSPAGLIGR